jgi:hypothetical protein
MAIAIRSRIACTPNVLAASNTIATLPAGGVSGNWNEVGQRTFLNGQHHACRAQLSGRANSGNRASEDR